MTISPIRSKIAESKLKKPLFHTKYPWWKGGLTGEIVTISTLQQATVTDHIMQWSIFPDFPDTTFLTSPNFPQCQQFDSNHSTLLSNCSQSYCVCCVDLHWIHSLIHFSLRPVNNFWFNKLLSLYVIHVIYFCCRWIIASKIKWGISLKLWPL